MKLLMVVLLAATGVGCGYSKSMTPVQPGTMPTITSLNPNTTTAGSTINPLTVDGTSFASNAVVNFNGSKMSTTFVGATQLTAMIPATATMTAQTVPVTVTNPGTPSGQYGGGRSAATSGPMNFTITP